MFNWWQCKDLLMIVWCSDDCLMLICRPSDIHLLIIWLSCVSWCWSVVHDEIIIWWEFLSFIAICYWNVNHIWWSSDQVNDNFPQRPGEWSTFTNCHWQFSNIQKCHWPYNDSISKSYGRGLLWSVIDRSMTVSRKGQDGDSYKTSLTGR